MEIVTIRHEGRALTGIGFSATTASLEDKRFFWLRKNCVCYKLEPGRSEWTKLSKPLSDARRERLKAFWRDCKRLEESLSRLESTKITTLITRTTQVMIGVGFDLVSEDGVVQHCAWTPPRDSARPDKRVAARVFVWVPQPVSRSNGGYPQKLNPRWEATKIVLSTRMEGALHLLWASKSRQAWFDRMNGLAAKQARLTSGKLVNRYAQRNPEDWQAWLDAHPKPEERAVA